MVSYLEFSKDVAREAGRLLLDHLGDRHVMQRKSSRIDLVTEVDRLSQDLIVSRIRRAFPGHGVVAEEGGEHVPDANDAGGEYVWFVDPLDGTTNYLHQMPFFSVSLALCRDLRPQVGVVYAPCTDEMFWAEAGGGAYGDGGLLHVSDVDSLHRALVSTGFPYLREPGSDNNLAEFARVMPVVQDVRRWGSAALDLAYLAAGRCDAYWEFYNRPWDILAGVLLVQEAGGRVSPIRPGDILQGASGILASNGHIHESLRALLTAGCPAGGGVGRRRWMGKQRGSG